MLRYGKHRHRANFVQFFTVVVHIHWPAPQSHCYDPTPMQIMSVSLQWIKSMNRSFEYTLFIRFENSCLTTPAVVRFQIAWSTTIFYIHIFFLLLLQSFTLNKSKICGTNGQTPKYNPVVIAKWIMVVERRWMNNVDYKHNNNNNNKWKRSDLIICT